MGGVVRSSGTVKSITAGKINMSRLESLCRIADNLAKLKRTCESIYCIGEQEAQVKQISVD